ncbi:MAG: transglycosylase SLT domain-containing protein [Halobacteriovoraceae bacterium]|jgi:membrane-bound lytic murein transglycosylase D|nr:transglycosylase SLT domain-containing protein [Halobacteriovoraceae bacterium]MBT5092719.1 transglycosylase SLT domain-containing protein [Halobacteriovoraceae bacterium]
MPKCSMFLMLLTLAACSNFPKHNNAQKADAASTKKVSVLKKAMNAKPVQSVNEQHAETAIKDVASKKDSFRIVGSSKINKSHTYNQKTYFLYGAEHLNLENYYFDIPVVYNKAVKKWINYFLNRGRGFFERYSARAGRYAPILGRILEDHGLPRDLIFLAMAESGFQNTAKSWAKAVGPWQFMPYTGRRFGLKIDWYKDERRDPIKATIAASRYLALLFNDFGSWELAAAAYNAGEGKVGRAIRRYRTENFWNLRKGRYLKAETKNYVPKIMALAILGKNLKSFGFEEIDFHEPLDFEEVTIKGATDLITFSKAIGIDFEEVQRLNPEILRWFTPPGEPYLLRLPPGYAERFEDCCKNIDFKAVAFQEYKVRGRKTRLRDVARKFKIKNKAVLTWLNGKNPKDRLKKNSVVVIPFRQGQRLKAPMYADLYERPRKSVRRRRKYRSRIRLAKRRGKNIKRPKAFYTVRRGDTLWSVSRKTGTSLDTLIVSNLKIVKRRMIRAGDRLVVR